ncbi:uncharacterized protein LOC133533445 [Cydia pomonella]|uniref:uncharacterized protein LOC133533445 n=1 Tax=Cydia pomonella TaxID=82600 RepID=UPI002ADD9B56|nr:uncharacterized protein LOC133533445 [Cydia pomonella]
MLTHLHVVRFEIWAGGSGLYTYAVSATGVCGAEPLPATPRVTLLAASPEEPYVALYCEPGVCVYQWSVRSRQQTARLDCSKLVPCSESLQSLALDSRPGEDLGRVTALAALGGALYVGTAWGVLLVCAAASLRPLAVFRPYEQSVTSIVPLYPHRGSQAAMLATLGTGYRPLLHRYAPQQPNTSNNSYSGPHCLLWRAGHWLPD